MGLLIGGAVFPTAFAITWRKQTKVGAISGCLSGLAAGLIAWLTTAKQYYGEITVHTTGLSYPTLAGNLAAIMTGLIVTTTISLIKPDDFDWEITRSINALVTDGTTPDDTSSISPRDAPTPDLLPSPSHSTSEKKAPSDTLQANTPPSLPEPLPAHLAPPVPETDDDPNTLGRAFKLACISAFLLTFLMDFLVPMPMFFSHYVFSKPFFTAWVVVSFLWVFASTAISCLLPVWETREGLVRLVRKIGGK